MKRDTCETPENSQLLLFYPSSKPMNSIAKHLADAKKRYNPE
jgi:hypothetical protein